MHFLSRLRHQFVPAAVAYFSRGGGVCACIFPRLQEGYSGVIESPEPPADGKASAHDATIWHKSFPNIKNKDGFVYKSEFAGRDQSLEVARLIDLLKSHKFELGLEDPLNCEHQYNTGLMYWCVTAPDRLPVSVLSLLCAT